MKTRIKIVPDDEPNAKGEWVDVDSRKITGRGWDNLVLTYADYVPAGFHIVAVDHTYSSGEIEAMQK